MKLLVSAFEAFGGESINPAEEALKSLRDADVIKLFLPVEYSRAAEIVLDAVRTHQPDAVVSVGQAGGRQGVTPEKYAVNLRNAPSPDSAGRLCKNEKIVPNGPDRIESTFGAENIALALQMAGIPSSVSESAGTYVCNDVMYSLLWALRDADVPAGFIHVPYCTRQLQNHPGCFGMETSEIARALEVALEDIKKRLPL